MSINNTQVAFTKISKNASNEHPLKQDSKICYKSNPLVVQI